MSTLDNLYEQLRTSLEGSTWYSKRHPKTRRADPKFSRGDMINLPNGNKGIVVDVKPKGVYSVQLPDGKVIDGNWKELTLVANSSGRTAEQNMVYGIAQTFGRHVESLESNRRSCLENIEYNKKKIEDYTKALEELDQKIEKARNAPPPKRIEAELQAVERHAYVESLWVSKQGDICVRTKDIPRISDYTENVEDHPHVGKFLIRISFRSGRPEIRVWGLSFMVGGHTHPHINGSDGGVCWGNYEDPIVKMLSSFEIYQCVDAAISFMATVPQRSGSPYVGYREWFAYVEPITDSDHERRLLSDWCAV